MWTTDARAPMLDAKCAEYLSRFLRAAAGDHRASALEIGAVRSHVHALLNGHPMTYFPKLIGQLKGGGATVWNKEHTPQEGWRLHWAAGYGLSTISPRQVERVRE